MTELATRPIAPTRRATASASSTRSNSGTLYGIVTLAPFTPNARAKVTKSSASAAGSGRYTASRCVARNAALCMAGDTEWEIGEPMRPNSWVASSIAWK